MALPLPRVVPDIAPGGGIVTAMGGINALTNAMLNTEMQKLKNKYYPEDIQSQIGYRNALMQGQNIQNQYLPEKLQASNVFAQLQNQFYAPNMQSEIENRNALTQKYNAMTPLEAERLRLQNQYYPKVTEGNLKAQEAITNYRNAGGAGAGVGQKQIMGLQRQIAMEHPEWMPEKVNQAASAYINGEDTLPDGEELPPASGIVKSFADQIVKMGTTAATVTGGIKAKQAEAELEVLNNYANEGLKPYGTTYFNKSPQQILDSFKTDNESQIRLGRFIAAQALQYEAAQNRIRLANGQPGVTSTEGLMKASGQIIDTNFPRLSGVARQEATRFMDEALNKGLQARNSVDIGASGLKTKKTETKKTAVNYNSQINPSEYDIPEGYIGMYKGNEQYFFPPDQVDQRLSEGYTYD